jgi:hypothetical protein
METLPEEDGMRVFTSCYWLPQKKMCGDKKKTKHKKKKLGPEHTPTWTTNQCW